MNKLLLMGLLLIQASFAWSSNVDIQRTPLSEREHSAVLYHRALSLFKEGSDIESSVIFHQVLDRDPGFTPARIALIKIFKKIGWEREVNDLLDDGLKSSPENKELLLEQVEIFLSSNNDEKALSSLLKIKEEDKGQRYKTLLAVTYFDLGLYELAQQSYIKLLHVDSNNMKWWLGLGLASEALGSNKQALNSYYKILKTGGLEHSVMKYVEAKVQILTNSG